MAKCSPPPQHSTGDAIPPAQLEPTCFQKHLAQEGREEERRANVQLIMMGWQYHNTPRGTPSFLAGPKVYLWLSQHQ